MNEDITGLQQKAIRSLVAAKKLFDNGDFDFAVSRAYYAMFYIAEAALLGRGKAFSKHTAIINGFYHEFVATGVLPKELHHNFHHAFDKRNIGDYSWMDAFSQEDTEKLLSSADSFVAAVIKIIET